MIISYFDAIILYQINYSFFDILLQREIQLMNSTFDELSKAQLKQLDLSDEDNRKIYLYKIISIVTKRLIKLDNYIVQIGDRLAKDEKIANSDADLYFELTEHHHSYLLNALGDLQDTSISYYKYRKYCEKKKYPIIQLSETEEEVLQSFNKERNFCNHIPESILVEDAFLIKNDPKVYKNKEFVFSNIGIVEYDYIDKDYFIKKHESIKRFYFGAKHMLECIINKLANLCQTEITISNIPQEIHTITDENYEQKAAKNVQKIDYVIPDEWITFEDE